MNGLQHINQHAAQQGTDLQVAEDDVGQEICERMGHVFRPSGARGIVTRIASHG